MEGTDCTVGTKNIWEEIEQRPWEDKYRWQVGH